MNEIVAATESLISQLYQVADPRLAALVDAGREALLEMLDDLVEADALDQMDA